MDLADMEKLSTFNSGYKWMLTCIDILSRYAWIVPIKSKTPQDVLEGIKKIFREHKPVLLQTDDGKEFFNKLVGDYLKQHNVTHFSVKSQFKAAIVERFHRSIKTRMWRYFTHKGTYKWIDVVDDLVDSYNRSVHGSTGYAPADVDEQIASELVERQEKTPTRPKYKYNVGDHVRISKVKRMFEKGHEANWSEEVFTIYSRHPTIPVTYKVQDYEGEVITGSFYEPELQKIPQPTEYRVERVLKTRTKNGVKEYYMKWAGYKQPTWTVGPIHKL